jgi:hypothetical protein
MELKAVNPVGKMAVVTDHDNDKSEVVKIDTLRLKRFYIDFQLRQLHIAFAWGGYDSTGNFKYADGVAPSERVINGAVDGEREIFNACALCPKGNPLHHSDFPGLIEKVLLEHKKLDDIVNGGWTFKDGLELTYNSQTVFKKS